ncbi:hypothetical protein GCM10027044_37640 [Hymenobacter ruber]
MAVGSCTKEKLNCGNAQPSASLRFHILDDRTGLEWLAAPRAFSLDTLNKLNPSYTALLQADKSIVWSGFSLGNDYGMPAAGGNFTTTYFLRLNPADTDTIRVRVVYGPSSEGECFRYAKTVDIDYNGRPAGSFGAAGFYCSGCGPVVAFRKRQ